MVRRTSLGLAKRLLLGLGLPCYRAWMVSCRVRWDLTEPTGDRIANGEPIIYALWHEALLPTPWTHRNLGLVAIVSRHQDGEIVARILESHGFGTARGSTTRGGTTALRQMIDAIESGHSLAITPDGPRGPRRKLQPGVVEIAMRSGAPVVPAGILFRPTHRFRSWDRMALPWPRAKGVIHYGDPLWVPEDGDLIAEVARIQSALDQVTTDVEERFEDLWRAGNARRPYIQE